MRTRHDTARRRRAAHALPRASRIATPAARARGFSLLEVLVALVIFSLAVLAQARLQWLSLSNTKSADLKTTAALLAADLADRMRANREAVAGGSYSLSAGTDRGCAAMHFADRHVAPATCTPAQLADDDLADWGARVAAMLPNGAGVACIDSTPNDGTSPGAHGCDGLGNVYAIKVWWTDRGPPSVSGAVFAPTTTLLVVGFTP